MKIYRLINVLLGMLITLIGAGISQHFIGFGILLIIVGSIMAFYNLHCFINGY